MEEATVHNCLDDIRKLLTKRDELTLTDPIGAAHIQSGIFRKFAILDWCLSALSGPTWLWRKLKFTPAIYMLRKLAKARKTDVKRMAIPQILPNLNIRSGVIPHESGGSSSLREFHLFQNLPPELQQTVLSKVTCCPECKLAVIVAIPNAEPLMQWDPTCLKLEQGFQILMQQSLLNTDDINNLRQAHPLIRDSINQYFDSQLVSQNQDDRCHDYDIYRTYLTLQFELVNVKREHPFLTRMYVGDFNPDYFRLLRKVGPAIWDCELDLQAITRNSLVATNRLLIEVLSLMPNLRRLRIKVGEFGDNIPEEEYAEWGRLEGTPLPKLGKLQNLNLTGVLGEGEVLVVRRMLNQYGKGLRTLPVRSSGLMQDTNVCCSRLTRLHIHISSSTEIGTLSKKLETFSGSPLDFISMNVLNDWRNEEGIINDQMSEIFAYGLSSFRETLEHLSVVIRGRTSKLKWIRGDLTFPKMRILEVSQICGNWLWLLQFPGLEELHVTFPDGVIRSRNIFKLKWTREGILNSSVWKLFPKLRLIRLVRTLYEPLIITRAECRFNYLTKKSSA